MNGIIIMRLLLEVSVLELGDYGSTKPVQGLDEVADRMDGTEIDGVRFSFTLTGDVMELVMEGENLSDGIVPNYPKKPLSPISQIGFKTPEARFTANTLNKLMRRFNKEFGGSVLLVREVKDFSQSS